MMDLDDDEKALHEAKIAWLAKADPDDWHRVSLDFNWDEQLYTLDWIVRQPNCDIATALDIFWRGEPGYWLGEDGPDVEKPNGFSYLNKQMCIYIAKRVQDGGYTRSKIAFVPDVWRRQDYTELEESARSLKSPNIPIHPDLIRNRAGREVDLSPRFYKRYPEPFHLSYFIEDFSGPVERWMYWIQRSIERRMAVKENDATTIENLPTWLKSEPDLKEIRFETTSLLLNAFFAGVMIVALLTGQLSNLGPIIGSSIGISALLYMVYSGTTSVQAITDSLEASGHKLSTGRFVGIVIICAIIGAGMSYLIMGYPGALRDKYGLLFSCFIGLAVVLPALWFLTKTLVDNFVTTKSISRNPA